jgi:hypothetical protein
MRFFKHIGLQPAWDMRGGGMLGLVFWGLASAGWRGYGRWVFKPGVLRLQLLMQLAGGLLAAAYCGF